MHDLGCKKKQGGVALFMFIYSVNRQRGKGGKGWGL